MESVEPGERRRKRRRTTKKGLSSGLETAATPAQQRRCRCRRCRFPADPQDNSSCGSESGLVRWSQPPGAAVGSIMIVGQERQERRSRKRLNLLFSHRSATSPRSHGPKKKQIRRNCCGSGSEATTPWRALERTRHANEPRVKRRPPATRRRIVRHGRPKAFS